MHIAAPTQPRHSNQQNKLLWAVNNADIALLDNRQDRTTHIAQSMETPLPCVHHIAQPSLVRNYAEEFTIRGSMSLSRTPSSEPTTLKRTQ